MVKSYTLWGSFYNMKNRVYSLLIPWFMDGGMSILQTAMPLLALRLGAPAILLGTIGWVAQTVRLPICLTSGRLSEKTGRAKVIVPAACIIALAAMFLGNSHSYMQIALFFTLTIAAIGAFYPPLQALVGDVSRRGELTQNLGSFNLGWCVGGAVAAIAAGWLVRIGLAFTCYVAAAMAVVAAILVLTWKTPKEKDEHSDDPLETSAPQYPASMLIIARMGHFLGFFVNGIVRVIFPKLGLALGWTEPTVAITVAMIVVGQGLGMIATNASAWWRGKLWPQLAAHATMLLCGILVCFTSSRILISLAFLAMGFAQSIAYTAALYHGLSMRKARGKNTGIHESLVAGGYIGGCLLGGLVAQYISLRAPYLLISCFSLVCIFATFILSRTNTRVSES